MSAMPPFDPKVSDGCSGGVRQYRRHLCVRHDMLYWQGTSWLDKWAADIRLGYWYLQEAMQDKRAGVFSWAGVIEDALFGAKRSLACLIFANRAFWNKPHKAGLSRWRVW